MTDYIVSPDARREIAELVRYVAERNPAAGARLTVQLTQAFSLLARRPGLGHLRPDLTEAQVRFWTVKRRYTIVYRGEDAPIQIVRVFGPKRDIAALLR